METSLRIGTRLSPEKFAEQRTQLSGFDPQSRDVPYAALGVLLQAYDYAEELDRTVWDFAVEIGELQRVGLTTSCLRWLACSGLVEHAREAKPLAGGTRAFRRHGDLSFNNKSCFVLTKAGVSFCREALSEALNHGHSANEGQLPNLGGAPAALTPKWDRDRQELCLDDVVVKRYKLPAPNQEQILAAFEEEGWPVHIDDPLSPHPDQDPKRRLHATINALNRHQKQRLIRFRGDGHGEGVCWELTEPSDNGE